MREARRNRPKHEAEHAEKLGLSSEEYQRYREALDEYRAKLWTLESVRKPLPEDFKGTSP
jgi:5-bromo-4-chloroindolyl phosphate hydrolysis protein